MYRGCTDHNVVDIDLLTPSAEGRVEHQKINKTAALLSFGSAFGVQLDLLANK